MHTFLRTCSCNRPASHQGWESCPTYNPGNTWMPWWCSCKGFAGEFLCIHVEHPHLTTSEISYRSKAWMIPPECTTQHIAHKQKIKYKADRSHKLMCGWFHYSNAGTWWSRDLLIHFLLDTAHLACMMGCTMNDMTFPMDNTCECNMQAACIFCHSRKKMASDFHQHKCTQPSFRAGFGTGTSLCPESVGLQLRSRGPLVCFLFFSLSLVSIDLCFGLLQFGFQIALLLFKFV